MCFITSHKKVSQLLGSNAAGIKKNLFFYGRIFNSSVTYNVKKLNISLELKYTEVRVMTKDAWSGRRDSHTKRLTDGKRVLVVVVVMVSTDSMVSTKSPSPSLSDWPFHDPKNSVISVISFITHCTELQTASDTHSLHF